MELQVMENNMFNLLDDEDIDIDEGITGIENKPSNLLHQKAWLIKRCKNAEFKYLLEKRNIKTLNYMMQRVK